MGSSEKKQHTHWILWASAGVRFEAWWNGKFRDRKQRILWKDVITQVRYLCENGSMFCCAVFFLSRSFDWSPARQEEFYTSSICIHLSHGWSERISWNLNKCINPHHSLCAAIRSRRVRVPPTDAIWYEERPSWDTTKNKAVKIEEFRLSSLCCCCCSELFFTSSCVWLKIKILLFFT